MLTKLLDLLIPSRCAACGARGAPCCASCAEVWGAAREVVRGPTAGLVRVFALARYRGVGRKLLIAYKERGRRDLAASLGGALAEALVVLPSRVPAVPSASVVPAAPAVPGAPAVPAVPGASAVPAVAAVPGAPVPAVAGAGAPAAPAVSGAPAVPADASVCPAGRSSARGAPMRPLCLVPAPSRPSAARVRGGPHIERLAKAAASILAARGIEVAVAPALELAGGARDAVGLGREQRMANLAGRLRFREAGRPPPDARIVVLDDVITTGATAAACTRVLAAEGFTVSAVLTLLATG